MPDGGNVSQNVEQLKQVEQVSICQRGQHSLGIGGQGLAP